MIEDFGQIQNVANDVTRPLKVFEDARREIAEANTVEQVNRMIALAIGLAAAETVENIGTRGGRIKGALVREKPTLAEVGIDKNLTHRARRLAAKSEKDFDADIAQNHSDMDDIGSLVAPRPRDRAR